MQQIVPVVIAFGANIGDRAATIRSASAALADAPGIRNVQLSRLRNSVALTPDGRDHAAPEYVNAVALADVTLQPLELLRVLQEIELQHGRTRDVRWGDRTLDLDLIVYGGKTIREPELTVPHPHTALRDFVLAPWLELDPAAALPGVGRVAELLERVGDTTSVWRDRPHATS